jgi:osmoprotectant transport system permease protein
LLIVTVVTIILREMTGAEAPPTRVTVGAKKFTESAILAELMAYVLEAHAGVTVERRLNLAGTHVCFEALRHGDLDLYAEYTGTGLRDILQVHGPVGGAAATFAHVSRAFRTHYALTWLAPFGFNNTYVLMMQRARAEQLGIRRLSDLSAHALRYGVSHEFLQRPDGLPGLRRTYALNELQTVGMEHDLAYRAVADGTIDVADAYSTDGKLARPTLIALEDDRHFFPPYEAAPLVRAATLARIPAISDALALLAGRIDDATMRRLNDRVESDGLSPAGAAAELLHDLHVQVATLRDEPRASSLWSLLWQRRGITASLTARHLLLTVLAVVGACLSGIPLGVLASRRPRLAAVVVGVAGALQTIPSIALLAFMLPFFGIGAPPAIAALFLYGLLPIVRNTIAGLRSLDPELIEVARALGMRPWQRLRLVELPLAAPVILAGVRTSTVISIGTATLAAFIGAGGLGDPIVTGLSVTDINLVLSGALPAAVLALLADGLLSGVERLATPRGLRLQRQRG